MENIEQIFQFFHLRMKHFRVWMNNTLTGEIFCRANVFVFEVHFHFIKERPNTLTILHHITLNMWKIDTFWANYLVLMTLTSAVFLRSKLCVTFGGYSNAVKAQCHNRDNSWANILKYQTNYMYAFWANFMFWWHLPWPCGHIRNWWY